MTRRSTATWRNWGRTQSVTPQRVERPSTAGEVAALVRLARRHGWTVKAVGSGHSFTGIAVAPDLQLDLSRMRGLLGVDADQRRATLAAGTRLSEIPALLAPYGLSMTNLGDIDAQTISGAISTGTHGTGVRFGNLSGQVCGLDLVSAAGELITVNARQNPELLDAVRVGLGALGVLTAVTLQCVPRFALRAEEGKEAVSGLLPDLRERFSEPDHFEFYWLPHTDVGLTKENTRLPGSVDLDPLPAWRRFIEDEVMTNGAFQVLQSVGHRAPRAIPSLNGLAGRLAGVRTFTDESHAVFTSHRRVRFREMEYAVPLDDLATVLGRVRDVIDSTGFRIPFPLEVRATGPDDAWLGMSQGRVSGYVSVHQYLRNEYRNFFDAVEDVFLAHQGRPHWGKLHSQDAASLAPRYPRFADFLAVRDRLDPDRVFTNPHLDRILGP